MLTTRPRLYGEENKWPLQNLWNDPMRLGGLSGVKIPCDNRPHFITASYLALNAEKPIKFYSQ